jgi:hypothetical protein
VMFSRIWHWLLSKIRKGGNSPPSLPALPISEPWDDPVARFNKLLDVPQGDMIRCPVCQLQVGHLEECPEIGQWTGTSFVRTMNELTVRLAEFEAQKLNALVRASKGKRLVMA